MTGWLAKQTMFASTIARRLQMAGHQDSRHDREHSFATLVHERSVSLGSEEAHEVTLTLASVRLSNCTYGFPVCSFRKDFITAEMPEKELA